MGEVVYQSLQAVITESHRLGGLKTTQKLLSHSAGDWRSEIRVPACLGSAERPLLGCKQLISPCSFTRGKEGERVVWPVLIRALIVFMRAPPS